MEVDETVQKTIRTFDEVESVLDYAKVERSEIKSVTQTINFSPDLDNDHVRLLELDATVLKALTAGEKVVIRGDKEDHAVLCTGSKTYDIKQGEVSNTMLLLPEMDFGPELPAGEPTLQHRKVSSLLHAFYELRPVKPRLLKLKSLLEENQYSGPQSEEDEDHQGKKDESVEIFTRPSQQSGRHGEWTSGIFEPCSVTKLAGVYWNHPVHTSFCPSGPVTLAIQKYTLADILNLVQASEEEIMTALEKMQAIFLEGYWRVLDFDFLAQILTHLVQLCEENDWIHSGIHLEECLTVLQDLFPRSVVEHVVKNYAEKIQSDTTEDDDDKQMQIDADFYRLMEDKICRFFAEQILRTARKFNFNQFLSTWEKTVPEGMKTSLHQLEGMALIDRSFSPEVIAYFPVDSMPEDISQRFNFLFRTQEKWTLDEITPYIRDLTTEKMDVKAMLTKFARSSMNSGVRVYNSRNPIT